MKHLRGFNESLNIYDIDWHEIVPKKLTMIYDDKSYNFICDQSTNIMKHFDMIQVTYVLEGGESWGISDCLEFDLYFLILWKTNCSQSLFMSNIIASTSFLPLLTSG